MKRVLATIISIVLLGSCGTTDSNANLSANAGFDPAAHTMWTRPNEVGYEILGDIAGEHDYFTIFGLTMGDEPTDSSGILSIIVPGNDSNDPMINAAALNAVENAPEADGIYITSHVVTETGIPGFKSYRSRVKGKAIKLVDLGRVSEERMVEILRLKHGKDVKIDVNGESKTVTRTPVTVEVDASAQ
jgi:hypothetical protein